ncbi:nuclear transport factor 2 family protein [Micromonospora narathiwatensis]|uniref:SnoaL-like domain-containing protein n=1 Tax=Micromonospora narathiwatensis TaxID=299146 RepID=A0A1A8ZLS9_9ACTN|nr:nuclear transport factor 2 family protein [Micromonospora narathiwatensis]SBT44812.1 SnoaL-like domain-containing protein [Micromonospora narathiwatensis]
MSTQTGPTPGRDLAGYLRSYVQEMAFGDEEPNVVMDRYHTPDIAWHSDGLHLDRERLAAHARPARRTVTSCALDIHDTLACGDRVAARFTLHAVTRGRTIATEIHMFGRLAPDGRLRRVDQLTRTLDTEQHR